MMTIKGIPFRGEIFFKTFNLVWVTKNHGTGENITETPNQTVKYNGKEESIKR